jgi:hypothetical protein
MRGPTCRAGGVRRSGVRCGRTSRLPRAGLDQNAQACQLERVDLDQRVYLVAWRNVGGRDGRLDGRAGSARAKSTVRHGGISERSRRPAGLGAGRWSSQPLTGLWHTWGDRVPYAT